MIIFLQNLKKIVFLNNFLKDQIKLGYTTVGKWSYGNPTVYRWDDSKLKVGNFCSIGPEFKIYIGRGNYRSDWITTSPFPVDQFSNFFIETSVIKNFGEKRGI